MMLDFSSVTERFSALTRRAGRDPRVTVRGLLGTLLLANLVAAYFVFRPLGGSPEELEQQARDLRRQISAAQGAVVRLKTISTKAESGRKQGETFLVRYFMERREASSTVVAELSRMAKDAGIRPRDHTFSYEPIEGTDNLSIMIVSGNYEGTYADLVRYLNRLDRSPRFIILDSLQAAPQQATGQLSAQMKLYTFVREGGPPTVDAPKPQETAGSGALGPGPRTGPMGAQPGALPGQQPPGAQPGLAPPQPAASAVRQPVPPPIAVTKPSPIGVPAGTGSMLPMQPFTRPGGPAGVSGSTGPAPAGVMGPTGPVSPQNQDPAREGDPRLRRPRFPRRSIE